MQTRTDFNTIQAALKRCLLQAERLIAADGQTVRLAARSHAQRIGLQLEAARQAVSVASQHLLAVAELRLTAHQATVLREAQRAVTDSITTINRLCLTVGERATGQIQLIDSALTAVHHRFVAQVKTHWAVSSREVLAQRRMILLHSPAHLNRAAAAITAAHTVVLNQSARLIQPWRQESAVAECL